MRTNSHIGKMMKMYRMKSSNEIQVVPCKVFWGLNGGFLSILSLVFFIDCGKGFGLIGGLINVTVFN